jgi:hypothetical protein
MLQRNSTAETLASSFPRATPLRTLASGESMKLAAVFDDERLAAETLDVKQHFEQRRGFGNQVLHCDSLGCLSSQKKDRIEPSL